MLASLLAIAVLHWAVLLIPGFNFVLIGQLAAGGSRRAAFAAVVGMTTATLIWAVLAVAGVGAVFAAQPALRLLAQFAGGLYLLYLAVQLFRSGGVAADPVAGGMGPRAAFRAGFLTSALNPKIALFYGSVFATAFPAQPSLWHIAAAVALVYANSWVWHGLLAFVLSRPRIQRAYLRHFQLLTRCSALLVGGFGVRLIAAAIQEARARA
ncbi:MAG: lysine transporter LysE [Haliea sp.]|nr:MAG: lysine transporter LysE [Haliea sp.]